jgi:nitrite reductase (NADH) large subunit
MAGRKVSYKGSLSRNVIRIFDLDVMTCGIVNPPMAPDYEVISQINPHKKLIRCLSGISESDYEVINQINPRKSLYRKLIFRKDILVGMVMVNQIDQGGLFAALIQSETPIRISKETLLNPNFNYKQLL